MSSIRLTLTVASLCLINSVAHAASPMGGGDFGGGYMPFGGTPAEKAQFEVQAFDNTVAEIHTAWRSVKSFVNRKISAKKVNTKKQMTAPNSTIVSDHGHLEIYGCNSSSVKGAVAPSGSASQTYLSTRPIRAL